jgi:hypothetical protein
MTLKDLVGETVAALDRSSIPYMISGSFALSAYTVPRMTRDIDIIIDTHLEDIEKFIFLFRDNFYINSNTVREEIQRRGMFNVIDNRSGYKIDFVVKKNSPFRKLEFERRIEKVVLGVKGWYVSLEDLILSKLIWIQEIQSDRQIQDIHDLLDSNQVDLEYLKKWIKELNLRTFNLIL